MMFERDVISLDIGTQKTKVVVGKHKRSNIIVETAFMFNTPANSMQDGKIIDINTLAREIKRELSNHKIKIKKTIITIESTAVIRREIVLPYVKGEELKTMILYEIEQYLPIMLSEYVIEYKITDEFLEDKIRKCKILVSVLPKVMAEEYLQLLKMVDLTPYVMDIKSNSISKIFDLKTNINAKAYKNEKTVAIIDMGYSNINLTIITKGATKFSRLVPLGGSDIDIEIANSFNIEMKHAEKKKIEEGTLDTSNSGSISEGLFNDIIKKSVDHWIEEIQRMFQYFTSRDTNNRIDEIYLHGGSSELTGMADYISTNLNISTSVIKDLSCLKAKDNQINTHNYLNAIGAIIRK